MTSNRASFSSYPRISGKPSSLLYKGNSGSTGQPKLSDNNSGSEQLLAKRSKSRVITQMLMLSSLLKRQLQAQRVLNRIS